MEVTLPSHRDLTVLVDILIGGHPTYAVLDSATMVTLVREDLIGSRLDPKNIGPVCVLSGIRSDPVHGRLVHNVPISVGTQTFLHTVCLFVCLFALRPKSTAMVIAGRSVHLTTLFPGQA